MNDTFAALADPTRRAILARLAHGEATVGELARPFALAAPTISKHLRVLEGARLIEVRREAQWRHCRLARAHLDEAQDWLRNITGFWEQSLDRLEALALHGRSKTRAKRRRHL